MQCLQHKHIPVIIQQIHKMLCNMFSVATTECSIFTAVDPTVSMRSTYFARRRETCPQLCVSTERVMQKIDAHKVSRRHWTVISRWIFPTDYRTAQICLQMCVFTRNSLIFIHTTMAPHTLNIVRSRGHQCQSSYGPDSKRCWTANSAAQLKTRGRHQSVI